MKSTRRNGRRAVELLHKARWAGYAAAGAMTVAAAQDAADAGIVYSGPLHHKVDGTGRGPSGDFFPIDFDNDALPDFKLNHHETSGFASASGLVRNGNWCLVAGFRTFVPSINTYFIYADRLVDQDNIKNRTFYVFTSLGYPISFFNAIMASGPGFDNSRFLVPGVDGEGYVGFMFDVGQGSQYGWAKVRMDGPENNNTFTVLGYAFAGPGEEILAGQVPEPGSLGLLATGAAGLLLWRRLRHRGTAAE